MNRTALFAAAVLIAAAALLVAGGRTVASGPPYVAAESPLEAGRYLIVVGGCNDCHTPQWGPTDGKLDQSQWLTGNPIGNAGPAGVSYVANLRLAAAGMTEKEWVAMFRHPQPEVSHAPMPWENVRDLNSRDIRAMYRFIKSLGPAGQKVPAFVPAGQTPTTAYMTRTMVPAKGQ
jgi:hypothetical protein